MRLTEKLGNTYVLKYLDLDYEGDNNVEKLGKLEDIEEELGISLETLFKALKQKEFFIKTEKYGIVKTTFQLEGLRPNVSYSERKWFISCVYHSLDDWWLLKDYGITWALTKEELEK